MTETVIRLMNPSDRAGLRAALVALHEHERSLSDTRLPGDATADAYLAWMLIEAAAGGAVLVAEVEGRFAGFAAGWVVEDHYVEETPELNSLRPRLGHLRPSGLSPPWRCDAASHRA